MGENAITTLRCSTCGDGTCSHVGRWAEMVLADHNRYKARAEELEKALRGLVLAYGLSRRVVDPEADMRRRPPWCPSGTWDAALAALDKAGEE